MSKRIDGVVRLMEVIETFSLDGKDINVGTTFPARAWAWVDTKPEIPVEMWRVQVITAKKNRKTGKSKSVRQEFFVPANNLKYHELDE